MLFYIVFRMDYSIISLDAIKAKYVPKIVGEF